MRKISDAVPAPLVFLFVFSVMTGCAVRPAVPPTRPLAAPCDRCISGVQNFAKVSPTLWRGAQPTKEGFRNLEAAGVKTVVSLREHHDDADLIEGTRLKYLRIPMDAWKPEEAEVVLLLETLERTLKEPERRPVFVHCEQGKDRTGYGIAAYRMVFEGWSADDAIHEMFDFRFHPFWFYNPVFLKNLDVERIRRLMTRAP